MRRTAFLFALIILVLSLSSCACGTLESNVEDESQYFAETKHTVSGPFLRLFESLGGASVLGLPLTEARFEEDLWVQYFENVCLESASETGSARLSKLGELYGRQDPPLPALATSADKSGHSRYFPQTGHSVCQAFLVFYDAHKGQELLGDPIAEFTIESGRIVQYFECGRLEWYPEIGPDEVRLGRLGEAYLAQREGPVEGWHLITSGQGDTHGDHIPLVIKRAMDCKVSARVKYSIIGKGREQIVEIRAADRFGRGISDLPIRVTVHDRSHKRQFLAPPTDAEGYTSCAFPVGASPSAYVVLVDAVANWQGHEVKGSASYFSVDQP